MKKGQMNLDLIMGGIVEVIAFLLFLLIMGGVIWFLYAVHTTIHITGTISNIVFLLLSGIPIGIVLYIFWPVLNLDKETESKRKLPRESYPHPEGWGITPSLKTGNFLN